MQINLYKTLGLILLIGIFSPIAGAELFEDFADGAINAAKFTSAGGGVELDTTAQELVIRSSARSYLQGSSWNRARLQEESESLFQADVKITRYQLGNTETQGVYAGVAGMYYNAQFVNPSNDAGEVWVSLYMGDFGDGLEVWYSISVGDAQGHYPVEERGTLDVADLELDTYYTASISHDEDNSFIFTFNGVSSGSIDGPERMGDALYEQRNVRAGSAFGQINSTEDPNDKGVDDGTIASIEARFDNITLESGLLDDFSGGELSATIWRDGEVSTEVDDETLVMKAISTDGTTVRNSFEAGRSATDYLGATTTLLGTSTQNGSTRVQARIAGFWYNDTYSETEAGNGIEGNIWAALQIERRNGAMRATANMWREDPDHVDGGTEVLFEQLGGSFEMDVAYELAIERTESRLSFYVDGDIVVEHPIGVNNFPIKGGEYKILRAEVREDAGEAQARFDNIYTDYVAPALVLNATNADQQQVALPTDTNVHEGEQVTLTAEIDDASSVAAYIWEQTAGVEVDISASPRPGLAYRIVGSDANLGFTVPANSNGGTLEFRVTVVDESGTHVSQEFALAVDNSMESTLAPTGGGNGGGGGGGSGSSAVSPGLLIFFVLSLWARRKLVLRYR